MTFATPQTPLIEAHHNDKHMRSSQLAILDVWIAAMAEQVRDMKPWSSVRRGWAACGFKAQAAGWPYCLRRVPTIVSSASSRRLWELAVAIGPACPVFCTSAVEFA
jgi:hypothetical protein